MKDLLSSFSEETARIVLGTELVKVLVSETGEKEKVGQ